MDLFDRLIVVTMVFLLFSFSVFNSYLITKLDERVTALEARHEP